MTMTIMDLEKIDDDIFVVCYGASLMDFDWERLRDKVTIAVNDAVFKVPNLSYHLFSDKSLWESRYSWYDYLKENPNTKLVCRHPKDREARTAGNIDPLNVYKFIRTNWSTMDTITPTNAKLFMSRTVVCPGVQLAWKLGAKNIYVLGFDCYDQGVGKKRITYANGKTQKEKSKNKREEGDITIRDKHKAWITQARRMTKQLIHKFSPEVKVYNLNPKSRADCWEKVDPNTVL